MIGYLVTGHRSSVKKDVTNDDEGSNLWLNIVLLTMGSNLGLWYSKVAHVSLAVG